MATVKLETFFLDMIEPVKEYVSEADHYELMEQIVQCLTDSGYNLKVLYGHDDTLDEALNHVYGTYDDEDEDEDGDMFFD